MNDVHTSTGRLVGPLPQIRLWLAGPESQDAYRHDALDARDRRRCQKTPALCERLDWRVSRVLKQYHREAVATGVARLVEASREPAPTVDQYSLSHSKGHAVLASANFPTQLGVDLEAVRLRDYRRMLPFFVSPDEEEWWQQQPDPGIAFYRLWTIKEALLKAQGLSFPADLPRVCIRQDASCPSGLRLEAPESCQWQGVSVLLDGRWLLSCVWSAEAGAPDPLIESRFVGLPPWQMTDACCFGFSQPMISSFGETPGKC